MITDMNIRFQAFSAGEVTAEAGVIKTGQPLCQVSVDLCDANRTHNVVV
jgi:hypothetical protein